MPANAKSQEDWKLLRNETTVQEQHGKRFQPPGQAVYSIIHTHGLVSFIVLRVLGYP